MNTNHRHKNFVSLLFQVVWLTLGWSWTAAALGSASSQPATNLFGEQAAWTGEPDQSYAGYGSSAAAAGDVNGDGYTDVLVSAPAFDNGQTDEGRAFIYHGTATGVESTAAWTTESGQPGARFGSCVAPAGDINGDGFDDVVFGAQLFDATHIDGGLATVFHGSAAGLAELPAWQAVGSQPGAYFGSSVAAAGDVNGDGYGDAVVGASGADDGQTGEGLAYLYHGSASGLTALPQWQARGHLTGAAFGSCVATAGDINGDHYSDVIVGAPGHSNGQAGEGHVAVFTGTAAGLSPAPAWTAELNGQNDAFGVSAATAGDVNGDGYSDVVAGAPGYSGGTNEGRAALFHGAASGLASAPAWLVAGGQTGTRFGARVAPAGDVNGDGFADTVVGAALYDNGQADEGQVTVYLGSAGGLAAAAFWTGEGDQGGAQFGAAVAPAGDVNGDGFADIIAGAPAYDNVQVNEGRALVFHGSAGLLSATPVWIGYTSSGGNYGYAAGSGQDVNGDGYADILVAANTFTNGQPSEGAVFLYHGSASGPDVTPNWTVEGNAADMNFGWSATAGGDVNGDGYTDIIVGAAGYSNGQTREGAILVYHGSPSGLSAAHSSRFESNQPGSGYGVYTAGLGDVNGDGYADIAVAAHLYQATYSQEGRVFVYHGSATGVNPAGQFLQDGGQAGANLGINLAHTGDVNRDGYSDLAVGAPHFDNGFIQEGRVCLYHGTAAGLSTTPVWSEDGNAYNCRFGYAVSGAGDINGDGFADLIIGAPWQSNGQVEEGRIYTYHGSNTGMSGAQTIESDVTRFYYGEWAAAAGDVNGDGLADATVSGYIHTQGRVDVFHGSAQGIAGAADWSVTGAAGEYFGFQSNAAGDVNGDGYGDVIVGAFMHNTAPAVGGAAFLYLGNADAGWGACLLPRQRSEDDDSPVAPLGLTGGTPGLRLRALARSPFGAGAAKLEAELKPLTSLLDGSGTELSGDWQQFGPISSDIDLVFESLTGSPVWHHRIRLRYHAASSPFIRHSRWFTMPWNGWQEGDVRLPPAPSPTRTPTPQPSPTPTRTPSATATAVPTQTPSSTPTALSSASPTRTPTRTPNPTATPTPAPIPSASAAGMAALAAFFSLLLAHRRRPAANQHVNT